MPKPNARSRDGQSSKSPSNRISQGRERGRQRALVAKLVNAVKRNRALLPHRRGRIEAALREARTMNGAELERLSAEEEYVALVGERLLLGEPVPGLYRFPEK